MFGDELNTNIADIDDIVDATVMLSFVFEAEHLEHVHHSVHSLPHLHQLEKVLLYVDVSPKIVPHLDVLALRLETQTSVKVPVAACHKHKVSGREHGHRLQPFLEFFKSLLQ